MGSGLFPLQRSHIKNKCILLTSQTIKYKKKLFDDVTLLLCLKELSLTKNMLKIGINKNVCIVKKVVTVKRKNVISVIKQNISFIVSINTMEYY